MANNSDTLCNLPDWYESVTKNMFKVAYYILCPEISFVALCAVAVVLRALYLEAKSEGAYWYQVFSIGSDAMDFLSTFLYTLCVALRGSAEIGEGADWFKSTYFLMWYRGKIGAPWPNASETSSLLFAVCLASDRVFALAQPFAYKTSNHKRRQIFAFVTCVTLGFGTSIYDIFRYKIVLQPDQQHYELVLDQEYITGVVSVTMNQIRNITRFVGLGFLLAANVALIYFFRINSKKTQLVRSDNPEKEAIMKANQRTLLIMTVIQSISKTIHTTCVLSLYVIYSIWPKLYVCGPALFGPILNISLISASSIDLSLTWTVSKGFRKMVFNSLPAFTSCCKRDNQVQSINTNA